MFGECELAAPPDYIREVTRYIQRWQQTGRFAHAVKLAQDLGYTRTIANAFMAEGLPPQYFYLAMQESSFDRFVIGPPTRWGIAKGMWQFIPETGAEYGLKIGPMFQAPKVDPEDERFNWNKATVAAAKYVKDIYSTDAQASGLLVMASYNWGEHRVIDLVRTMPQNPRDRNFWQLLAKHGTSCRCRPTITCSTSCRRRSSARTPACSDSTSTTRWRSPSRTDAGRGPF